MVDLSIWNVKFSGDLSTKSDTQRYLAVSAKFAVYPRKIQQYALWLK